MGNFITQLASQFRDLLSEMSVSRRVAILIFMGLVISSFVALMVWSSQQEYRVLYSNLSQEDASAIVSKLREQGAAFRMGRDGGTILVPEGKVHEFRLALAQEGIPTGGSVGFEIFDRSSLGMTDFVQRVNFLRALQGELGRTISQLRSVASARVHIVIPERSLFTAEKREPSASVVIKLAPRAALPKNQVKGIVHLVASAVEGLDAKNVTVVDTRGGVLAGGRDEDEESLVSAAQMELKAGVERRLERRIESMLAKVVGQGRVIARVDVDLNFRRIEKTRELFDPDKQVVRSQRKTKELNESGTPPPGGVPGVQSNVPASETGSAAKRGGSKTRKSSRVSETVNFEIDKTVERIVEPRGDIKRISVAVMVDGTYTPNPKGGAPTYKPRSKAEIANFREIVAAAVGIRAKRGDTLKISSAPFGAPPGVKEGLADTEFQSFVLSLVKYMVGGIVLVLVFLFVVRPMLGWMSTIEDQLLVRRVAEGGLLDEHGVPLPPGAVAGALEAGIPPEPHIKTPEEREAEEARKISESVYEFVTADPERTANLIRAWIKQRP